MDTVFALRFIASKMRDMGYKQDQYILMYRHLVLAPSEVRTIDAFNQFYYLIQPHESIAISSDWGIYDLLDDKLTEQIYEHQGTITLTNHSAQVIQVKFIQVIAKNK
jgi:hypothetical protein